MRDIIYYCIRYKYHGILLYYVIVVLSAAVVYAYYSTLICRVHALFRQCVHYSISRLIISIAHEGGARFRIVVVENAYTFSPCVPRVTQIS